MSSKPEDDRLLDHNYDGIQEYDNPLPKWWVYLFWATIVFSIVYAFNVPGVGIGKGRIANYEREMAAARARYGDRLAASAPASESDLLAIASDTAKVSQGKATFDKNCMPCHRADGGGMIGPNLTDAYWIHGGHPLQVLKTVTEGVPQKGMPAWGLVMKPNEVASVVAYVLTLRGTHPPSPKAPQGVREDSTAASADASSANMASIGLTSAGAAGAAPSTTSR